MENNSETSTNERSTLWSPFPANLFDPVVTGENLLILIRLEAFESPFPLPPYPQKFPIEQTASWLTSRAMDDLFRQQPANQRVGRTKKIKTGKIVFPPYRFSSQRSRSTTAAIIRRRPRRWSGAVNFALILKCSQFPEQCSAITCHPAPVES